MSAFYERLATTAARLLKEKGQPAKLRRMSQTVGTTPWRPASTFDDLDVFALILPTEKDNRETETSRESEQRQGESIVYLSGQVPPIATDFLICDSREYRIKAIDEYKPAGLPILYRLTVYSA